VPADTLVRIVPCPGVLRAAVGTILFAGNSVTKERILRAELDFHEGDTLTLADLSARLEANRSRLFNLQLFHGVVAQASCGTDGLIVVFGVQERHFSRGPTATCARGASAPTVGAASTTACTWCATTSGAATSR
jgi:hypothetical protein